MRANRGRARRSTAACRAETGDDGADVVDEVAQRIEDADREAADRRRHGAVGAGVLTLADDERRTG